MWQFDRFTNTFIPGTLPADGKISACYIRLSQEDEQEGESGSVLNQRDFLLKYCTDNRFQNVRFFSDDGYSGVNFDRPGFSEMMELVEQGRVSTIIVKDHSRLGRNRLVVGALMEQFTEDNNVRYIAVTDGIDSNKGFDDMVAVRELFNEFYPRDVSKKIRAVFTNKGNSGQRLCTQIPYWLIGINGTRLFTTLYKGKTLNVGRVLAPTLALLAEREAMIQNFKKEKFYTVES